MSSLQELMDKVLANFRAILPADSLDILIVAFVIYELLRLVRRTRAGQLAKGALVLLLVFMLAKAFNMRTVAWLLDSSYRWALLRW